MSFFDTHAHFSTFRGEPVRVWMEEHPDIPVVATLLYLVLVLWVPERIMKHREPFNLRPFITIWNLLLTLFSWAGAYVCAPHLYRLLTTDMIAQKEGYTGTYLRKGGLYETTCVWNPTLYYDGIYGIFVMLFILSKIPEMFDTAFLVLQKKPVVFLHWFHHSTVMLFCWHAYISVLCSGLIFSTMNYCVHAIMYFYYLMCSLGMRKVVRPFAPFITFLQIAQMVVGVSVELYSLYHIYISGKGCANHISNCRLGALMYISYFCLFSQLFKKSYLDKKPVKENGTTHSIANGKKKE